MFLTGDIMSDQDNANAIVPNDEPAAVVNGKEFKYFFKTEKLVDADGNEVGEGRKHPDVKAVLPVPTAEEVVQMLATGGPAAQLIMDSIQDTIFLAGRAQINAWREQNPEGTFTATNFDLEKLTLTAIALTPKKERGGWTPSEEELKAFIADYTNVMVHQIGYDPKKVGTHCKNFEKGLVKIKSEKPILAKVKELLTMWASKSEAIDEHSQTFDWFNARIDRWMKAEEKNTAEAF